jgi:hypothetical protein
MKKSALTIFSTALFVPALTLAQQFNPQYATDVITTGRNWLGLSLTVIMAIMTLFFLISVFNYIREKDAGKLAEKRKIVLNGVLGLFIAVSVWGIVRIFQNATGTTYYNSTNVDTTCPPGTTPRNGGCY